MVTVQVRSAVTLIPRSRSTFFRVRVISDCWKSYNTLQQEGYIQGTVNLSIEFVNSQTGDHTQTIASTCRAIKQSLPQSGSLMEMYYSYFAEYIFWKHYQEQADDCFLAFLKKPRKVYQPSLT
uniref:ISXO2-like transposase domain-containing protein n=1 Tax=Amphimedon queenslandica TaxID=400682 RepID=A0A1X7TTQ9_AMPQE